LRPPRPAKQDIMPLFERLETLEKVADIRACW